MCNLTGMAYTFLLLLMMGALTGAEVLNEPTDCDVLESGAEAYWCALESGATVDDATESMRRFNAAKQLKAATHGGPIYWALRDLGASDAAATYVLHRSTPKDEVEYEVWRSSLLAVILELGFSEEEAISMLPQVEISLLGEDECWVYPVKIMWCDGGFLKRNSTYYLNALCWNSLLAQCFVQTCGASEAVWYSVTIADGCLPFLPAGATCVSMSTGSGTFVDCDSDFIFSCDCIEGD